MNLRRLDGGDGTGPRTATDTGRPERAEPAGPILVVDDEPGIREVVKLILESRGHEIVTAGDTAEAQRILGETRPRAILLDLVLREEDGLTFLKRIKSDGRYAPIPVLVITGRVRRGDRSRVLAAGAEALLTKPFDELAVLSWLDSLVARRPA
jgi:CheY-like chemotaxis protein